MTTPIVPQEIATLLHQTYCPAVARRLGIFYRLASDYPAEALLQVYPASTIIHHRQQLQHAGILPPGGWRPRGRPRGHRIEITSATPVDDILRTYKRTTLNTPPYRELLEAAGITLPQERRLV